MKRLGLVVFLALFGASASAQVVQIGGLGGSGGGGGGGSFTSPGAGIIVDTDGAGTLAGRTFESSDGSVVWTNPAGAATNPSAVVDNAVFGRYTSGAGAAPGTCSVGVLHFKTDTNDFYVCTSTNTQTLFGKAAGQTWTGSHDFTGGELLGGSPLRLEGTTNDNTYTTVVVTDPTSARTFTLPNADSVAVQPLTCSGTDKVSAVSSLGVVTCSADDAGASSLDLTKLVIQNDFCGGKTTQAAGEAFAGFSALASGTETVNVTPFNSNNPCVWQINATGSDNSGGSIRPMFSSPNYIANATITGKDWELDAIGGSHAVTSSAMIFGFSDTSDPDANANSIRIIRDTDRGHTTFVFQVCTVNGATGCDAAGDNTTSDTELSTITPVADTFYLLKIRHLVSGVGGLSTYYFSVNGETEITFCSSGCTSTVANLPAAAMEPWFYWKADDNAANNYGQIDFMYFKITGLTRY